MLIRIVKLSFKPENIPSFERLFEASKTGILAFEGCRMVELYQDISDPSTFFTYSHWDGEAALEGYRNSEFFREVWATPKSCSHKAPRLGVLKGNNAWPGAPGCPKAQNGLL